MSVCFVAPVGSVFLLGCQGTVKAGVMSFLTCVAPRFRVSGTGDI